MDYPSNYPNNYNPYMYNRAQMQMPQQPQPTNGLIKVSGLESAKVYPMGANSAVALFDSAEDLFYLKTTDASGFPSIRTFAFTEVQPKQTPQIDTSNFVSKDDFLSLKNSVDKLVAELGGGNVYGE